METITAMALVLLVLACPLGMLAIGGVVWVVARARGEKKEFSASCMQHGNHQRTSRRTEESELRDQVTQLQAEVELLRAQSSTDGSAANNGAARRAPRAGPELTASSRG